MKKRFLFAALMMLALFSFSEIVPAHADAAPPVFPPGASIDSGGVPTHVQMLSEHVDITIEAFHGSSMYHHPETGGHVEAYFYMLNQGDKPETMDVRFPLRGTQSNEYYEEPIEGFNVWVDHEFVENKEVDQPAPDPNPDGRVLPWATWPMTFEPGKLTTIHVSYEQEYSFYGYEYVLETGAGWYGPIGSGTITAHYPFELNSLNANARSRDGMRFEMSGTDLTWTFSNLEPTAESNISFEFMNPGPWGDIIAARQRADLDPGSLKAQLGLARALQKGLYFKYELVPRFNSDALVGLVIDAYEQALHIEPRNEDVYLEYLKFLDDIAFFNDPPDPRLPPLLDRALAINPNNRDFLSMQLNIKERDTNATTSAIIALTPSATHRPTLTPSATLPVTLTPSPTDTLTPSPTQPPSPTLTASSQPPAATPAPSPTPIAVPPAGSANLSEWTILVLPAAIAVIILAVWLRRSGRTPSA